MADDKRIERIELKVDGLSDKLSETNIILAKQHESLRLHMKRSDMLEESMKPLQRHVSMVDGALKLVGLLAALTAILEAIHLLLK